jgi:hypothetical protein
MNFLAATTAPASQSFLDRLREVPTEFWMKVGLAIVGLVVAVWLLRKLAGVSKIILWVVGALGLSFLGFNWIYERNEPAWATPVVETLAGFFPTKGRAGK